MQYSEEFTKLQLTYVLKKLNKIFEGLNPKWKLIHNPYEELIRNKQKYPTSVEFINAADLYTDDENDDHYILFDEDDVTIKAWAYHNMNRNRIKFYLNKDITSEYLRYLRAFGIDQHENNTKPWFIFRLESSQNFPISKIYLNRSHTCQISRISNILKFNSEELERYIFGNTNESFGFAFSYKCVLLEKQRILDYTLRFLKQKDIL